MAELNLHPDVKAFKEFAEKNPKIIRAARSGDRDLNDFFKHYQKYGEADSLWDQFIDDKTERETKETGDKKKKWSEQLKGLLEKIEFDNINNLEEKKRVAQKIVKKVKDGQVIRIWFWLYFIFSYNSNS